jgi:hypothetical protein
MNMKPDAAPASPSLHNYPDDDDYDDKAVPSSSTYQPGQLDEYLDETKENQGKHSHGQRTMESSSKRGHRHHDHHHHRKGHHHHSHNRAEENMSRARSSRGQDDGVGALPVEMKPRTGADTKPRSEHCRNETVARLQVTKKIIDMEGNKAVARHPAAASYPGAVATDSKEKSDGDTEPNKATRSVATHLDNSSVTKTSAIGVDALASTTVTHGTGTARAYNTRDSVEEEKFDERQNIRVGAVVVPGLSSSSRHTSEHSASTDGVVDNADSLPPPSVGEEQPLQAMLVADRVSWGNEEADIEAQLQARMRDEAEDIANMVQERIFRNTTTAVVHNREALRSEDIETGGKRRKKICILLVVVSLVIAGAIGAGIALSKDEESPTPQLTSFRNALYSVSGKRLDDENSPQYQALQWIANDDPAKTSVGVNDTEIIKQRYVAAVLYFALGGKGWKKQYKFLSEADICSWNQNELSGIICNATNGDMTLHLCKSSRLILPPCPQE